MGGYDSESESQGRGLKWKMSNLCELTSHRLIGSPLDIIIGGGAENRHIRECVDTGQVVVWQA